MNEASLGQAGKLLRAASQVVIFSHIRPDGDAVGAVLGMGLSLQEAGKQVQMVLADGVPATYRHLPGADQVRGRAEQPFGLLVALDCADSRRFGSAIPDEHQPDLNIDHHVTNEQFGRLNLVDAQAVSTTAMLAEYLPDWGFSIGPPVAASLLTGLLTDTLGFRTSNMTPQALRIAAGLVEAGADLPLLYNQALVSRRYEAMQLWGLGLARLQRQDRLVWTRLTQADRQEIGYPGRDDADLINLLSAIQDIDVALIFVEQPDGAIKVSWRAAPGIDVAAIAQQFGGGGHSAAAGATLEGEMENVQARVLQSTRQAISFQQPHPVE